MITSDRLTYYHESKSCESGAKEIKKFSVVPGLVAAPSFDSRVIQETEVPQNEEFRDMEYIPQIEELQFQDDNGYEGERMLAAESLEKFEARDSLMNTQDLIERAGGVNGIDPGIAGIELGKFHYYLPQTKFGAR